MRKRKSHKKIHLIIENSIPCNKNMGGASGWLISHTGEFVTCKHCTKAMSKGIQMKLNF
jgi:hypothetical protein